MNFSMRGQLLTIICLVTFFALGSLFFVLDSVLSDTYERHVRSGDIRTTAALARNIYQQMDSVAYLEQLIAEKPQLMKMSEREQRIYLRRMLHNQSIYELLALVDMDGMQIARSHGTCGDRSDREWFREFNAGHKTVVSAAYYSSSAANLITTLVQGIYYKGQAQGILMADIRTEKIEGMMRFFYSNHGGNVYLLDQAGNIIVQPDRVTVDGLPNIINQQITVVKRDKEGAAQHDEKGNLVIEKQPLEMDQKFREVLLASMEKTEGSDEFINESGERYLYTFQTVDLPDHKTHWTLVLLRDYGDIRDSMSEVRDKLIFSGMIVALLALAGILFFAQKVTGFIYDLVQHTQAVRKGDFSESMEVKGNREMRTVAETFNGMLEGLRAARKQQQEAEEKISDMAFHDNLTHLPNRAFFNAYARDMMTDSMRRKEHGVLFIVDADKFKLVNDTYGHAVGDKLLVEFGRRLTEVIGDEKQVCRFGGDEFIIFLNDVDETVARAKGRALVETMRHIFVFGEISFHISASIGAVLYGDGDANIEELMRRADVALYAAKVNGRDQVIFYQEDMEA